MGSRERPQPSAVSLYPGASGRLSLLYAPPPALPTWHVQDPLRTPWAPGPLSVLGLAM